MLAGAAPGARADPPPAAAAAPSAAPDEAASGGPGKLPQVTVVAPPADVEHRVYAFVNGITHRSRGAEESLERWNAPLCFFVLGLPRLQGEFVLDRLSRLAASVGAALGPPHCHPNFFVIVTPQPEQVLQGWRKRSHDSIFGDADLATIRQFLATPRPIRVWYNAYVGTRDALPLPPDRRGVPADRQAEASRLVWNDVRSLGSVIVVVDSQRVKGLKFGQLADYIGMVGLTEIDLDADLGNAPTLLRLFSASPEPAPAGLTHWDQAFLKALYSSDQSSKLQGSQIALRMVRAVAH
jgi:hypothetical protein